MALLHVLKEEGFRDVVVCHLDHGLRGEESAGDAEFVNRVGEEMDFVVELGRVELREIMAASGASLETAGRKARHEFFGACARKYRCGRLLLGHHADDQAETVLWNLMRGSLGCRGMEALVEITMGGRKMEVLRPLLEVRKVDLERWMRESGFGWREDVSNAENDVVRNRLRNEALPLLEQIANRDVRPMLVKAAEVDAGWRELLEWAVEKVGVVDPQGRLHVKALRELPEILQRGAISDFLRSNGLEGLNSELLNRCVGLLSVDAGPAVNLPGGGYLRRRAGRLVFVGQ